MGCLHRHCQFLFPHTFSPAIQSPGRQCIPGPTEALLPGTLARPLAAAHDRELPAHVCKHFVQRAPLRRPMGDPRRTRGRSRGRQNVRCTLPHEQPVVARGSARRLAQKARVAANEMRADQRSTYAEVAAHLAVAGAARARQRASWRTNSAASALQRPPTSKTSTVFFLALSGGSGLNGRAPGTSAPWPGEPSATRHQWSAARATGGTGGRQWGDNGGVNSQLNTPSERESVGDDLDATLILALIDNIEITHRNIGCDHGPSFTTNTSCCTLERDRTGTEDARAGHAAMFTPCIHSLRSHGIYYILTGFIGVFAYNLFCIGFSFSFFHTFFYSHLNEICKGKSEIEDFDWKSNIKS